MHSFRSFRALRVDTDKVDIGSLTSNHTIIDSDLVEDEESNFYLYEMSNADTLVSPIRITGVFGILTLTKDHSHDEVLDDSIAETTDLRNDHILPHEQVRSDITTKSTLSPSLASQGAGPIWAIADIDVLDEVNSLRIGPIARTRDKDRFSHRLFALPQPTAQERIRHAVEATELVLADGHHRVRAALNKLESSPPGTSVDLVCFVCQAKDISKVIRPIHRIFRVPSPDSLIQTLIEMVGGKHEQPNSENRYIEICARGTTIYVGVQKTVSATISEVEDILSAHKSSSVEYFASRDDAILETSNESTIAMICPAIPAAEILYSALKHRPLKPKSTLFFPKPLGLMILREA